MDSGTMGDAINKTVSLSPDQRMRVIQGYLNKAFSHG